MQRRTISPHSSGAAQGSPSGSSGSSPLSVNRNYDNFETESRSSLIMNSYQTGADRRVSHDDVEIEEIADPRTPRSDTPLAPRPRAGEKPKSRQVTSNGTAAMAAFKYPSNYVSTAKYTVLSFIPKNLFQQFCRIANLYFLLISILQLIPGLSPTGQYTTILPLGIVVTVTAVKDAYEDYKRHKADKEVNNRPTTVLRDGHVRTIVWEEVLVGDIVRTVSDEPFCADLVLLSSSDPLHSTSCYVETSSLDGETNLKLKTAVKETSSWNSFEQLAPMRVAVDSELPNKELYKFEGSMRLSSENSPIPLSADNILLRGMTLKNTKFTYGLVIFSGPDTKLMQNSTLPPHKRSHLERRTNFHIAFIFLILFCLAVLCAILFSVWVRTADKRWYLQYNANPSSSSAISFFTFLILFNNLIPISLYVSLELVKVIQAYLISNDLNMYYAETDTPAVARTSSLNEELGQVQYVFSDKTGTLTQNKLEFLKCSIGGEAFGHGVTEVARAAAKRQGMVVEDDRPEEYKRKGALSGFFEPLLIQGAWTSHPKRDLIEQFFLTLAMCHSVVPSSTGYQAASPDDLALVNAAKAMGFVFVERTVDSIVVNDSIRRTILGTLEFSSSRKRMSIVLRDEATGEITLLCKGADSVILPRLSTPLTAATTAVGVSTSTHSTHALNADESSAIRQRTCEQLQQFADEGLRTLCICKRKISEKEYKSWAAEYETASVSISDRERKMEHVAELIEKDLELIGATAIEDKLQDGVPETIEVLAQAGIHTWVLTGDKMETAINIGFACALLDSSLQLIVLNQRTVPDLRTAMERGMSSIRHEAGMVIDGDALSLVLLDPLFLKLAEMCRSVICCRVSPSQKAEVVRLVRSQKKVVTLAIGDGANDVSMIQEAHVGVGIAGVEGTQAARSSDYSIGQFRFLQRLLLVHGRWCYRRNSKLILYSFYKNTTMFLCQLWFVFFNGFSGQTLFEKWSMAMYNLIFTAFPILAYAVFDRDVSDVAALRFPKLYGQGRDNKLFTGRVFWMTILNAIYHSLLCFFLPYFAMSHENVFADGRTISLFPFGVVVYGCVVFTITAKLCLEISSWTVWNHVTCWGSLAVWFVFMAIWNSLYKSIRLPDLADPYDMFFMAAMTAGFWLLLVLVPMAALLRDFVFKFYKRNYRLSGSRKWLYMVQLLQNRQNFFEEETAEYLAEEELYQPPIDTGLARFHLPAGSSPAAGRSSSS